MAFSWMLTFLVAEKQHTRRISICLANPHGALSIPYGRKHFRRARYKLLFLVKQTLITTHSKLIYVSPQ